MNAIPLSTPPESATRHALSVHRVDSHVYARLRGLARSMMRRQHAGHTLEPTALVNESLLRLAASDAAGNASDTTLVALAATTMRRVLINHARDRAASKRQPDPHAARAVDPGDSATLDRLLDLDAALRELADHAPRQARVAELHYFGGRSVRTIGSALGVSVRSVQLDLATARAFIIGRIGNDHAPADAPQDPRPAP